MTTPGPDKRLPVDDETRGLAQNLVRTARIASLGTLDPEDGGPLVTRVAVASDGEGMPLVLVSDLAPHTTALRSDGRCSLLLAAPLTKDGDPLRHARITIKGQAAFLIGEQAAGARERFLQRHPHAAGYIGFSDFHLVRIVVAAAYLNGGFARAYLLEPADVTDPPIDIDLAAAFERARLHMNADHRETVAALARRSGRDGSDASIVTIDARGFEIVAGNDVFRVEFEKPVTTVGAVRQAFVTLAKV